MAKAVKSITGVVAAIDGDNIDTDQIIPSREIKGAGRQGLSDGLFSNQRYLSSDSRAPNLSFVLNQAPFDNASVLISGKNFGCGSSREHAVWALCEFGIKAVIAESFGEIFFENCLSNGLAPLQLTSKDISGLKKALAALPDHRATIDLETQSIVIDTEPAHCIQFELAPSAKERLTSGLDSIGLTEKHKRSIEDFIRQDRKSRAWAYPQGGVDNAHDK